MRRFRAGTVTQAHGLNTRVSRRSFSLAHSNTYESKSINAAIYKRFDAIARKWVIFSCRGLSSALDFISIVSIRR
jgi:hypothetical protein